MAITATSTRNIVLCDYRESLSGGNVPSVELTYTIDGSYKVVLVPTYQCEPPANQPANVPWAPVQTGWRIYDGRDCNSIADLACPAVSHATTLPIAAYPTLASVVALIETF